MKVITDTEDWAGKKVFVRVDWNVPIENGAVADDFRIKVSLPTVKYLLGKGAHVSLATHFEQGEEAFKVLKKFVPEGAELLPNLRSGPREEANDESFAKELASKADVYVNEAFSVSHRNHASVVGVPKLLPSFAGLRLAEEVKNLSKAFNPSHPFLLILGGAKFETKIPLVEKFLNIADEIFIAGAIAKPASLSSLARVGKVVFPLGDIAALDADDANLELLKQKINSAQFIVWNGPLGKYEEGYKKGTLALAKMLSECGKPLDGTRGKETIVGGGDTLAAIKDLGLEGKFTFVSTGGGAMLDYLATGTLPGIEALDIRN